MALSSSVLLPCVFGLLLWPGHDALAVAALTELLGLPGPLDHGPGRLRVVLASLLPAGGMLYVLRQLWVLSDEYLQGRVFSRAAHRAWLRFARGTLALALLLPLARGLISVAFSLDNPPGQRFLMLNVGWYDGLHVLFGLVLVVISGVMVEAQRLAEDNAGFI